MGDGRIRVLLIEDNPGDARLIREFLIGKGGGTFRVDWAEGLEEGLRRLVPGRVDIVLLDLSLPESKGLDTVAKVLTHAPWVPAVVLTGLDDQSVAVEAVRRGAQDYLVKGQIDGNLLGRAIRYAIERKEVESKLADANTQLEEANRRLGELATTDVLTGLWNRRRFMEMLEHECQRVHRTGGDLALAMLDLDHFKSVNDTFGHAAGDRVLVEVAAVMREAARATDGVARYGGEEFLILMPDTTVEEAVVGAERIRQRIADHPIPFSGRTLQVTVSIGVGALAAGQTVSSDALLKLADEALYAAKQGGRNCTRTSHDLQAVGAASGQRPDEPPGTTTSGGTG